MNRAQRRAQAARDRNREPGRFAVLDAGKLFLPGEETVETEVLVRRAVAGFEEQWGSSVPRPYRASFEDGIRKALQNISRSERGLPPVGSAKHFGEEAVREGERLLAELLPRAREIARTDPKAGEVAPWIAEAFRDHGFGIGNLEAVMVYPAEPGMPAGWHGDVMFSRMMDPLPNMIGTRTAEPCPTREEAEARALELLAMCCFHAKTGLDA